MKSAPQRWTSLWMNEFATAMFLMLCACTTEPPPAASVAPRTKPDVMPPRTPRPPLCTAEVDLICPEGYHSGCYGGVTTVQACIKDGTVAKAACAAQIVVQCGDHEYDSCFFDPPYGPVHVCVR